MVLPMSLWDDEAGYDRDDPKHPGYGEMWRGWADDERKRRKENAAPLDHDQQPDRYSRESVEAAEAGVTPGEVTTRAAGQEEVGGAAE